MAAGVHEPRRQPPAGVPETPTQVQPNRPDLDVPALYSDRLLARVEMAPEGQRFIRFHEAEIVWAYPTDQVENVDGGWAQVWVVSRTLPHDWDPSLPRDEP